MTSANLLQAPIAVIGMACRLPGADGLDEYWQMLQSGRSGIRELPPDRLDKSLYYDAVKGVRGKTYSTLGGLISERPIDRTLCPMSDEVVADSDPCHQIMCEVAASACRHAGFTPGGLPQNSGVFIGHSAGSPLGGDLIYGTLVSESADYLRDVAGMQALPQDVQDAVIHEVVERCRGRRPGRNTHGGPATDPAAAAALIARVLGTDGPALVVDAACASSMLGLSLGCLALLRGQIDVAIVGGASFNKSDSLVLFSAAQSCSATASRPFDARADGLISSEGYVSLVLKTLDRAERDGDRIYGVLRGIGVSSDGRGNSLWAPRKEGQIAALERAYDARVGAASVQYIEAHATSTQVGDAIEIEALAAFFEPLLQGRRIPIGSVKSNIGHTLETAGLASVLKVLLAMQHGQLPPTVNLQDPNPSIVRHAGAFEIVTETIDWPRLSPTTPRRAAVNSFGIGGLNAHVVLDDYIPQAAVPAREPARPLAAEPIAIIGRGVVLPGAYSVPALAQLLASGRDARGEAPADRWRKAIGVEPGPAQPWRCPTSRGGYVRDYVYDWRQLMIPPKQISRANPLQFMLLDAAVQALRESGYSHQRYDKSSVSVVVGTAFGGEFSNQLLVDLRLPEFRRDLLAALLKRGVTEAQARTIADDYQEWLLRNRPALLDETGSFTSSTLASRVAKELDVMGGALAIDAENCSSFAALDVACNLLHSGANSMVFCAGAQRSMGLPSFEILSLQGHLDAQGRGITAEGKGFLPGEGVALVLLKRLSDARRDGDPILGEIHGVGSGLSNSGLQAGIELAATRSGIRLGNTAARVPSTFEGACGVRSRDAAAQQALARVYGRTPEIAGNALIDQIGHTQAAYGLANVIKATLSPPESADVPRPLTAVTTHSESGLSYHVLVEVPVQKPAETRPPVTGSTVDLQLRRQRPTTAGATPAVPAPAAAPAPVSAAPVVPVKPVPATVAQEAMSRVVPSVPAAPAANTAPQPTKTSIPQPVAPAAAVPANTTSTLAASPAVTERVIRVGARTQEELLGNLRQAAEGAAAGRLPQLAEFRPEHTWRVALLAGGAEDAAAKLQLAATHGFSPSMRSMLTDKSVFLNEVPREAPRMAFVFPGQGSSYAGMLADYVNCSLAAKSLLRDANALLARQGLPGFEEMSAAAARPDADPSAAVWSAQGVMLIADLIVWTALQEQGIRPDCVAGHSYGEFAALYSAGVFGLEQALRITRARVDAITSHATPGTGLLSLEARVQDVEKLLKGIDRELYITHGNAPQQTVVGGRLADLAEVAAQAAARNLNARELRVPRAFHSPFIAPAQWPFRRALATEVLRPASLPMLSGVSRRYVADPEEIRQNLTRQLVEPLNYVQLVERLADDGVTVFLEVGPQQVLTRLNRQVLSGRPLLILAADQSQRGSTDPRLRLTAALETLGWRSHGVSATASYQGAPVANGAGAATAGATPGARKHELFDATQVRREQARKRAAERSTQLTPGANRLAPVPPATIEPPASRLPTPPQNGELHAGEHPHAHDANGHSRLPVADVLIPSVPAVAARTGAQLPAEMDMQELQKIVIDFIVDHTGYPAEIIDIDWDLEADLGIDSIKRAQLLGDLRELFDLEVVSTDDLSTLTELRTVRQILELVKNSGGKREWLGEGPGSGAAPARSDAGLPQRSSSGMASTDLGDAGANVATAAAGRSEDDTWPPLPGAWPNPVPAGTPVREQAVQEAVASAGGWRPMDALSAAPAGVALADSPAPYRPIPMPASMPVAQPVMAQAVIAPIATVSTPTVSTPTVSTPAHTVATLAPAMAALDVLEPVVAEPAPVEMASAELATQDAPAVVGDPAEWEKFLVDFVVEHTGYPREVVDMDADLEADLGIDSIQRAQLFGEMREHFHLGNGPVLTADSAELAEYRNLLAEHRTLRQLMDLLKKSIGTGSMTGTAAAAAPSGDLDVELFDAPSTAATSHSLPAETPWGTAVVPHAIKPVRTVPAPEAPAPAAATSWQDPTATVQHDAAYRRGLARGAEQAEQLKAELRRMADNAGRTDSAAAADAAAAPFPAAELAELAGMADGAGVHLQNVLAWERRRRQAAAAAQPAPASAATTTTTAPSPKETATVAAAPVAGVEPPAAETVTSRYSMQIVPIPPKQLALPGSRFLGSALIIGENSACDALAAALQARGTQVHRYTPTDNPDDGVQYLEECWKQGPVTHLFLLTPRDPQAATTLNEAHWQQRRARGILTPYRVCQRWIQLVTQAKLMDDAGLVALASLGGTFGFTNEVVSAESGALTGLLKSIMVENWVNGFRTLPIKLLDARPGDAPTVLADHILGELDVPTSDMEIAWVDGIRHVVRCVRQAPPRNPRGVVVPHGAWVCTGGARGITAYVATELAKRYGLTLCLLGTAPVPQISDEWRRMLATEPSAFKLKVMQEIRATGANAVEGWRNVEKAFEIEDTLRKLAERGIRAKYYSCDVGNRQQLAAVLRQVRADFGPIQGVLHGAGYSKDARFDRKLPEKVDQCIRAKVDGAFALMELTANDPLTHFIGFGSISGRFGANGHTDYSLSNDMLSKQIDWYRRQRPEVGAVTFHWHAWGDLGMAMKPESRLALEMVGIQFMPAKEGLAHLLREIEAGVPESEVLITDDRYYRMYVPVETLVETGGAQASGEAASPRPLLDAGVTTPTHGGQTTAVILNPKTEPFLIEHRLEDRPLLPVVIALELFCESAGKLLNRTGRLTLRNAEAKSGLRFFTDNPLTIQMQTEFNGMNSANCRLACDFRSRSGMLVEANRGYFQAVVEFNQGTARETRPLPQIPEDCWHAVQYAPRESRFYLGPNFQRLRKFALGEGGRGWGKIVAPPLCDMAGPNRSVAGWVLPCAALDACLYATGLLGWAHIRPGASLPVSFGELRFVKSPAPGEACIVETRFVRQDGPSAWFDFTLLGSDGDVILEARDYRIAWLGTAPGPAPASPGGASSGTVEPCS